MDTAFGRAHLGCAPLYCKCLTFERSIVAVFLVSQDDHVLKHIKIRLGEVAGIINDNIAAVLIQSRIIVRFASAVSYAILGFVEME